MNKKILKTLKAILTITVLLGMSVVLEKVVNAWSGSISSGMADSTIVDTRTGYFPQATSNGIIYCNDQNSMIRFGYTDEKKYYASIDNYKKTVEKIDNERIKILEQNDNIVKKDGKIYASGKIDTSKGESKSGEQVAKEFLEKWLQRSVADGKTNESPYETLVQCDTITGDGEKRGDTRNLKHTYGDLNTDGAKNIDFSQPFVIRVWKKAENDDNYVEDADISKIYTDVIPMALGEILDTLNDEKQPMKLTDIDKLIYNSEGEEKYSKYDGADTKNGPMVAVPTNNSGNRGYSQSFASGNINTSSPGATLEQIVNAYIYSGRYHTTTTNKEEAMEPYNYIDIQVANWLFNDHKGISQGYRVNNEGDIIGEQSLTQGVNNTRGDQLLREALAFYKFDKELKQNNGYYAIVNTGDSQIFVSRDDKNRSKDEYIIGPVSITYPYYKNISYLTDLKLLSSNKDGNSATLSYVNGDFSIIIQGQEENFTEGIRYPKKNENFYIVVNASRASYPDYITIKTEFEYTDYAKTNYYTLNAETKVYQYRGDTSYGKISLTVNETWEYWHKYSKPWTDEDGYHSGRYMDASESHTIYASVYQGVVKMDLENPVGSDDSQQLRGVTTEGEGGTFAHKTTASAEASLDLKIQIGGRVWVDEVAGKESNYDGQFNSNDTPMSNVTVKLHQRKPDGSESVKSTTKTNSEGKYSFEGLNALYTYYVEFVYNGQYYQPTTYKNGDWANSSKGVDKITDRNNFNAQFKEIGSNPKNYANGEIYTRDDLEEAGLIDKFGNPIGSSNQYVNDCMISSWTGYNKNGFHIDYYPVYNKFIIGREINGANKASIARDSSGKALSSYDILYTGKYNNLCVNQGYVLREIADLAARKDVLQTTLEMNGKTPHVYKYNKNNDSGAADVNVRLADYYYGTNYTREIYKEDYYKPLDTNADTKLDQDDWLKIYVTYKIRLSNQSEVIDGVVQEIVDYYDDEYTLIGSDNTVTSEQKYKPYIGDRYGKTDTENIVGKGITVTTNEHSKYGTDTEKSISGYNKTYIRTASEVKIPEGGDLYIYITFKVNSINNLLVLDDGHMGNNDNGKANIIEINGYSTYYTDKSHAPNESNSQTDTEYKAGDIAGLADRDSIPGNLKTDEIAKLGKTGSLNDIPESVTSSISQNDPDYIVKVNLAKARWLREKYGLEDDSDKAPSIKIKLYDDTEHERKISGTVWDDSRYTNSDLARIGNGQLDNGEAGIQNVKVELIDMRLSAKYMNTKGSDIAASILVEDEQNGTIVDTVAGKKYKWTPAEAMTDANGNYYFSGYIPSNYVMKFTYGLGSEEETIKYNGQDYKSTTYNMPTSNVNYNVDDPDNNAYTYDGTANNKVNAQTYNLYGMKSNNPSTTYFYNLAQADVDNKQGIRKSDARDIMGNTQTEGTRQYVNNYSNNSGNGVTNALSQQLHDTTPKTYMIAQSGQINVELEYDRTESQTSDDVQNTQNNAGSSNTDKSGYYYIENLDFGLVERPKAQIKITKQIANIKVTLANGNTLFDASGRATNVMWMDHKAHGEDTENTYAIGNNYKNQMMKEPVVRANSSNKGKIQLTMDEELMHGSTLQVTYNITAANIGEVDYLDNQFYYTGKTNNTALGNISKTSVDTLIDYVGTQVHNANSADDKTATRNNLQFNKAQNEAWNAITAEEIQAAGLLNSATLESANKHYTTIITTDALRKGLVPIIADESNSKNVANALKNDPLNAIDNTVNKTNSVVGVKLVLSQMITQDNSSDDMVYNNMVELVKSSNSQGRRMAYTVSGNQDPTVEPQEIDADDAQEINILPPFGQNYIYYVLGTVVAIILIAGIAITIRTVRKK